MKLTLVSLLLVIISTTPLIMGAKIIITVTMPMASSHALGLAAIGRHLQQRGHEITILTSSYAGTKGFKDDDFSTSVQYHFELPPDLPPSEQLEKDFNNLAFEPDFREAFKAFGIVFYLMRSGCQSLFEDSAALAKLKEAKFDILIGDAFDGCEAMLSSYLGIPHIAVTTGTRYPLFNEHTLGIPSPSSYVPFNLVFPFTDKMSFLERVANFFEHNLVRHIFEWPHFRALNEVKEKHGIAPGKSIQELQATAELWFGMSSYALDFPRPTVPSFVGLGGLIDVPLKPLPKQYADFVEGSGEHGFILFSLGTHFSEFPRQETAEVFARVFSELPQRVIWRYTGPRPRNLGNNTMIVTWMPQNDLLGHPKVRLLMYHGGLAGIYEAIRHKVPMIVMPIFAEQPANAARVTAKGMGRLLRKDSISYVTVKEAIVEVLENPSYMKNIRRYSDIYKDRQNPPGETVIFWVEHILKFGGSHLRTRALELNFIQLHSIDVLAFIVGIALVIVFLLILGCKRCISCCVKSKKTKLE
ncbi:UDP-glucuronosyltransferase 1-2-like [Lytechinus pictus]|uniref:UDP-glucuronosyltransferase 1-2-like n=1 Tax=Lytechinus pictus TaxID=7653 RepID=UPI0030B9DF22